MRFVEADEEPPPNRSDPRTVDAAEIERWSSLCRQDQQRNRRRALVSENTVKRHLVDIMEKLHLQNRIQLAFYAVHQGWIMPR